MRTNQPPTASEMEGEIGEPQPRKGHICDSPSRFDDSGRYEALCVACELEHNDWEAYEIALMGRDYE